jgi:hypothetical protein
MPSCVREHLNRGWLGALEDRRQIADHTSVPLGQSKLDRLVQVLDDITEPAGDLNDDDVTHEAGLDPHRCACGMSAGWLLLDFAQHMGRRRGRTQDEVMVGPWRRGEGLGQRLGHGELYSVVPGTKDTSHRGQEQQGEKPTTPGSGVTKNT